MYGAGRINSSLFKKVVLNPALAVESPTPEVLQNKFSFVRGHVRKADFSE